MKSEVKEIIINGIEYVKKGSIQTLQIVNDYVIVRTYSAGVHAGELVSRNGKEVELKNARRIWYWDGAASLSQMAIEGVSKPQNCKFPCEVTKIILTEAIEIIPCTQRAIDSMRGVPIWKE